MAFSASISLILVATVCCYMANATRDNLQPLPFDVNRQSKQAYAIPLPLYNYYNPYVAQVLIPTAQVEKYVSVTGDVTGRQSSEDVTLKPAATECLLANANVDGYGGCTKGSRAPSGNIIANFAAADQVGFVALVPNPKIYSKVKITCSNLTNAVIYTKSGAVATTANSPVTESKQTQVVIVSTAAAAVVQCSWQAS